MQRATLHLVLALAVLAPGSFRTSSRVALKNPLRVRVTSVNKDTVPFTIIRHDGFITLVDHPNPHSIDTLRATTPLELIGSGGTFLFLAGSPHNLRVEAWRQVGNTAHVAAEGARLTLRAERLDGVPDVHVEDGALAATP
jgi:hypothetical protein